MPIRPIPQQVRWKNTGGRKPPLLHVAIPVYDERDWLPATMACLARQTDRHFKVWLCLNQPQDKIGQAVDQRNRQTLAWLKQQDFPFPLRIINALLEDTAPPAKQAGVGWARKKLFDAIVPQARAQSIVVSLDADTQVHPTHLAQVRAAFEQQPHAGALAMPYYHPLPGDPMAARHILRYEIYLRYYTLQLMRIRSPYAYMPIGSAMAFRVGAYTKISGMSPRKAGEDFYFLQQLRKTGPVLRMLPHPVMPSPRPSARNPFGTGPTMSAADLSLAEQRYPFHAHASFDKLETTLLTFPLLFAQDHPLPIDSFLAGQKRGTGIFDKLRANHRDRARFLKACHEYLDGLRTLQFLHVDARNKPAPDAGRQIDLLLEALGQKPHGPINFVADPILSLNRLRDRLYTLEQFQRWKGDKRRNPSARW